MRWFTLAIVYLGSIAIGLNAAVADWDVELTNNVIERGKQEFIDTCALCHGEDAKGDGPLASYLTIETPDLTQITLKYEGEFPFITLYHVIDGQKMVSAHGSRKMPVWGDRYKRDFRFRRDMQDDPRGDTYAFGRIMELVVYLHSIQE